MNILIVNTQDNKGGASRAAFRLHKGLISAGIESKMLVQIKYTDDHTVYDPISYKGRLFGKMRPFVDAFILELYRKRKREIFSPAILPSNLKHRIRQFRPDVVNLHWIAGGLMRVETLGKIDRSIIWTLHDSWPFTGGCHIPYDCSRYVASCGKCPVLGSNNRKDISYQLWKRKNKTMKHVNVTIVAPSKWLAGCAKSSSLFKDSRIEVIPNGIDTDRFRPINKKVARELLGLPHDMKIVLYGSILSTLDRNKGFHLLLEALKTLKMDYHFNDIEIAVFGSSEPKHSPTTDYKISYFGHLYDEISLILLYSAADVMVVPSIQEAFGQTALESMACGTPVVAFGATGLLDIVVHNHNGYLAKPYDAIDLASGINWVLSDTDRIKELSHNSRNRVKNNFDIHTIADRYIKLYNDILQRSV